MHSQDNLLFWAFAGSLPSTVAQTRYLVKCVYFGLSAYHRSGMATKLDPRQLPGPKTSASSTSSCSKDEETFQIQPGRSPRGLS